MMRSNGHRADPPCHRTEIRRKNPEHFCETVVTLKSNGNVCSGKIQTLSLQSVFLIDSTEERQNSLRYFNSLISVLSQSSILSWGRSITNKIKKIILQELPRPSAPLHTSRGMWRAPTLSPPSGISRWGEMSCRKQDSTPNMSRETVRPRRH